MSEELERLKRVYAGYASSRFRARWNADNPGNQCLVSERVDAARGMLNERGMWPPTDLKILDVGCGAGGELARFLDWGADPSDLFGVDVLCDRIETARRTHPAITFLCSDASRVDFSDGTFDLVLCFTLFTSVLDVRMQHAISREMDRVLKPGGRVLWYDFRVSAPWNPRTIPIRRRRIARLFPDYVLELRSISVLPPLARRLGPLTSTLYPTLARVPLLRTHLIGLLEKTSSGAQEQ